MIIYAAVNHHLANVGVEGVKDFEKDFLAFMASDYPEVGMSIKTEGKLTEETESMLIAAIEKCKDIYLGRKSAAEITSPEV